MKLLKCLGDVQKTPEWEAVRKRNAWVNIYNPGDKFCFIFGKSNSRNDSSYEEIRSYIIQRIITKLEQ